MFTHYTVFFGLGIYNFAHRSRVSDEISLEAKFIDKEHWPLFQSGNLFTVCDASRDLSFTSCTNLDPDEITLHWKAITNQYTIDIFIVSFLKKQKKLN